MTKTEQDDLVKTLARIEVAEQITETHLSRQWALTLANYRGKYNTGAGEGDVSLPVNIVHALTDAIVPSVYFRDPAIRLRATIQNTETLVKFREERLNYLIKKQKFKKEARRAVVDAFLFGVGLFKIGYEAEFERAYDPVFHPETGEAEVDAQGQPLFEADGALFVQEASGRMSMVREADGYGAGPGRDYPFLDESIEREFPYAKRWSPWDFLKDPLSLMPDCSDAEWIAFRASLPVDVVRNHPQWKNNKDVEPTQEPDFIRNVRDRHIVETLEESKRVQVYEVYCKQYDKKSKSMRVYLKVVVKGHNKFLYHGPSPLAVRGFPVVGFSFIDNPESPFPLSPVEMVRPQIDAINIARTQAANHRERFHHKYLFNKNAGVTERDAKRFARGKIGAVLGVKVPPEMPASTAFQPAAVPSIDQAINQEVLNYWSDIQRGTGINEHHLGGAGIARQATQASYIESALGVRLNMKQDLIADAILEVCAKWTDLDRQYGQYEESYKLTGIQPEVWETFVVAESIPADFDMSADMHIAAFQAVEQEKKEMLELLNLTANIPGVNMAPILERVFKAYGFPTPETMFQQPPPMMPGEEGTGSLSETAIDSSSANRALNQSANAVNS